MRIRRNVLLTVIAAGLVAIAATAIRHRLTPAVTTVAVIRADLEQRVLASGRVRVTTPVQLAAQTSRRVLLVNAPRGRRRPAGSLRPMPPSRW